MKLQRFIRCLTMIDKRIIAGIILLIGLAIGVYFVYFHKGSAEDMLALQAKKSRNKFQRGPRSMAGKGGDADYDYDDDDPARQATLAWEEWINSHNHVSIGELYDKCDGDDKIMMGKVIMIPDKVRGGVMSRTYSNVTHDREITGGEMFIECQYNGKDLYNNHWDLCTVEEGMDDQIIFCPIAPGKRKYVKDLDIPNYLPKGRYSTKAWMTDQDDKLLGCAYSDFTL